MYLKRTTLMTVALAVASLGVAESTLARTFTWSRSALEQEVQNLVTVQATVQAQAQAQAQAQPPLAAAENPAAAGTPNPASEDYPNGRPWQAVDADFTTVMAQLVVIEGKVDVVDDKVDVVDDKVDVLDDKVDALDAKVDVVDDKVDTVTAKVDEVKGDTEAILERLDGIDEGLSGLGEAVAGIAEDVSILKNALDVELTVVPDADRVEGTDDAVVLFVHVSQNGAGVEGLTDASFSYVNAFPMDGAAYCGAACFAAGPGGVYAIQLDGTWDAGSYAGSLTVVSMTAEAVAQGSALVNFDVPVAPAP